jgi:hypothetical protein
MLFRFVKACWIPVEVSGLDKKLDALFLINGAVNHILQRMKDLDAIHAGFGDALLELPAGFVEKNGVVLSDRLEIAGMIFTAVLKSNGIDESIMAKPEPPKSKLEPEPKVELGKRRK